MFLYFVPGRNTLPREQLASLGLGYILDKGANFTCCQVCGSGPGGQPGVCVASVPVEEISHVKVDLANQVWRQIPGSAAWVGHWKDKLPTPEQLARGEQLAGHWLELLDGNAWHVPIARDWIESDEGDMRWRICLPQRLDLAADGHWVYGEIVHRYQPLWELTESWINHRCGKPQPQFAEQGDINAAVFVLQTNYKIGRTEAALLGILKDELVEPILDCLIDWAGWLAYCKKKAMKEQASGKTGTPPSSPTSSATASTTSPPAGSASSAGPAAEIPATAPPAPT